MKLTIVVFVFDDYGIVSLRYKLFTDSIDKIVQALQSHQNCRAVHYIQVDDSLEVV